MQVKTVRPHQRLIERSSSHPVYEAALDALTELMHRLTRNDVLLHYSDNVVEPVRDLLTGVARNFQAAVHPIDIYIDYQKFANAYGRFFEDGAKGAIIIELRTILDRFLDFDALWDDWPAEMDLTTAARFTALIFAHEFKHYQQHLKAWGKKRRKIAGNVFKTGASSHLAHSNEIEAHAMDAARQLRQAFGHEALAKLRTREGIAQAISVSSELKRYAKFRDSAAGAAMFRSFLKHLFQQLVLTV